MVQASERKKVGIKTKFSRGFAGGELGNESGLSSLNVCKTLQRVHKICARSWWCFAAGGLTSR